MGPQVRRSTVRLTISMTVVIFHVSEKWKMTWSNCTSSSSHAVQDIWRGSSLRESQWKWHQQRWTRCLTCAYGSGRRFFILICCLERLDRSKSHVKPDKYLQHSQFIDTVSYCSAVEKMRVNYNSTTYLCNFPCILCAEVSKLLVTCQFILVLEVFDVVYLSAEAL